MLGMSLSLGFLIWEAKGKMLRQEAGTQKGRVALSREEADGAHAKNIGLRRGQKSCWRGLVWNVGIVESTHKPLLSLAGG